MRVRRLGLKVRKLPLAEAHEIRSLAGWVDGRGAPELPFALYQFADPGRLGGRTSKINSNLPQELTTATSRALANFV